MEFYYECVVCEKWVDEGNVCILYKGEPDGKGEAYCGRCMQEVLDSQAEKIECSGNCCGCACVKGVAE